MLDAICSLSLPETVLIDSVAAVSVGIVDGVPMLDLQYSEDVEADVDMNLVMTGSRRFIEIQGTGEEYAFSQKELQQLLTLGKKGIRELLQIQFEEMIKRI
jgi:ribonuclease PH